MSSRFTPLHWLTLAFVGAILVVAATQALIIIPGRSLPVDQRTLLTLAADDTVEQLLTTEHASLVGLRIWLAATPPEGASLRVRVAQARLPALALVEQVVPLAQTAPDGVVEIRFEPLRARQAPDVLTATLNLQLTADGLSHDETVALWAETDSQGPAVTLLYQSRLMDQLWPVSPMTVGRHGIVNWAPLYVLPPYLFLVLLAAGLWVVWRRNRG